VSAPLARLASKELLLVVRIHVFACELPAHDDPVVLVVLDERDFLRPRDTGHLPRGVGVGALGGLGMRKHHQREVEAHRLHCDPNYSGHPPLAHPPNRVTDDRVALGLVGAGREPREGGWQSVPL
jgi:hypothetical protein